MRIRHLAGIATSGLLLLSSVAFAENVLFQSRSPMFDVAQSSTQSHPTGSLFRGASARSLFAPLPAKRHGRPLGLVGASQAQQLFRLIGHAESRRDAYDAVQYGAVRKPPKKPTQLTIAEIYAWIEATPNQPHAIGRYQFIPPTLRRLVTANGTATTAQFTPALQDELAMLLLEEAGYAAFLRGELSRINFMNNLAKIWAGLPNSSGKSHYHGYAGNKASMSWDQFYREMGQIFPHT